VQIPTKVESKQVQTDAVEMSAGRSNPADEDFGTGRPSGAELSSALQDEGNSSKKSSVEGARSGDVRSRGSGRSGLGRRLVQVDPRPHNSDHVPSHLTSGLPDLPVDSPNATPHLEPAAE
jgi:hypothetical protein